MYINRDFPCTSAGKEATFNARDSGLIPGLGSSPGEGIGYPLQYSRVSLWLRWKRILLQCRRPEFNPRVGKIHLEEGTATHSSILAWRVPTDRGARVHRAAKSRTQLSTAQYI